MSLVNEALRKAAQQAAAQRTRESGESPGGDLSVPGAIPGAVPGAIPGATYEPTPRGGGRATTFVIGGSTVVIAVLLIGVIVAIKSTGGPARAAAGPRTEQPAPVAPAPDPQMPKQPLLDVRPHPATTDLEPVLPDTPEPVEPVTPDPEPVEPVTPVIPDPVEPDVDPSPIEPVVPTPAPAPEPIKLRLVPEGEYFKTLDVADAPPMELGAIIFSERLQAALLNGRMVEAGSNVDGVKVEAVEPKRVTLRSPLGVKFYMTLP